MCEEDGFLVIDLLTMVRDTQTPGNEVPSSLLLWWFLDSSNYLANEVQFTNYGSATVQSVRTTCTLVHEAFPAPPAIALCCPATHSFIGLLYSSGCGCVHLKNCTTIVKTTKSYNLTGKLRTNYHYWRSVSLQVITIIIITIVVISSTCFVITTLCMN